MSDPAVTPEAASEAARLAARMAWGNRDGGPDVERAVAAALAAALPIWERQVRETIADEIKALIAARRAMLRINADTWLGTDPAADYIEGAAAMLDTISRDVAESLVRNSREGGKR